MGVIPAQLHLPRRHTFVILLPPRPMAPSSASRSNLPEEMEADRDPAIADRGTESWYGRYEWTRALRTQRDGVAPSSEV